MTEPSDAVEDSLRRAIEAADIANDAAEDVARLGKAQKDFVDQVARAQKRASALATGAILGAVVALALAGLVYLRAVGDLHEAAELQAEAARLIAEEVIALKKAKEEEPAEDPKAWFQDSLPGLLAEAVAGRLAADSAAEPAAEDPALAAINAARDEILAAMAELDLAHLAGQAAPAGQAPAGEDGAAGAETAPAAANGPSAQDLADIRASLARIEAGMLRQSAGPAVPQAAAPTDAVPSRATNSPARTGSARRPAPAEAAADPAPFSYP